MVAPGDLKPALERAVQRPGDGVVVGGGDGTLATAAEIMMQADRTLGVLPLGTMNLLAKDLGLPLELEAAIAALAHGRVRRMDVAEVNSRLFLSHAVIGLYPRMVREREQFGTAYDNSVRVAVRIPLAAQSRNAPRMTAANAELIEAQARLVLEQDRLQAEIDAAQAELTQARAVEALAEERFRLAADTQGLHDKAFRLGELDLPSRLRSENERFDAELALSRARLEAIADRLGKHRAARKSHPNRTDVASANWYLCKRGDRGRYAAYDSRAKALYNVPVIPDNLRTSEAIRRRDDDVPAGRQN